MRVLPGLWLLGACAAPGGTPSTPTSSVAPSTPVPSTTSSPTAIRVVDRIPQVERARVDVLWVVQATPGSVDLQQALLGDVPSFLDYLLGSGIDYHLGVVSSDVSDPATAGHLREAAGLSWVDPDTADPAGVLAVLLGVGETSTAPPAPLGAAYTALELEVNGANLGFRRGDAALLVIVAGDGTDATDPTLVDVSGFDAWFDATTPTPSDSDLWCVLATGATGVACSDRASALGGASVQQGDLPEGYGELGLAASGLTRTFHLSRVPVDGTLEVEVEDPSGALLVFAEGTDYAYDPAPNAVTFTEYVPNQGSTVVASYEEQQGP